MDDADPAEESQLRRYNYQHFWIKHLLADLWRSAGGRGLTPGVEAPPFDLESTDGARIRLSELRGQALLLHFASET